MRRFTCGLLYCAMLKLYPYEKHVIMDYWNNEDHPNRSTIGNLALVLIRVLFDVKRFVSNSNQYFLLLARLSSLGHEIREFMLKARTIGRLMEFYFDDYSPHRDFWREMTEIIPTYTEQPEIGLPTQIDRKTMN